MAMLVHCTEPAFICLVLYIFFNPLNAGLNPICRLLALLGAHPILHISRIRVNHSNNSPCRYAPPHDPVFWKAVFHKMLTGLVEIGVGPTVELYRRLSQSDIELI